MPGEVVTLQFGCYSNFIGSHFWNIQDEYSSLTTNLPEGREPEINQSLLFRERNESRSAEGAVPRLVIFEKKGSTRTSAGTTSNDSIDSVRDAASWDSQRVQTIDQRPEYSPNGATQAAPTPHWSQIYQRRLTQHSLFELDSCNIAEPFNQFPQGSCSLGGSTSSDEAERAFDMVRYYLEECDHLQGFQCLVDVDSGWGGFYGDLLKDLRDECAAAPIVTYAAMSSPEAETDMASLWNSGHSVSTTSNPRRSRYRQLNLSMSAAKLAPLSDLYIPMSSSHWDATSISVWGEQVTKPLNSSLLLAMALDTTILPWRRAEKGQRGIWSPANLRAWAFDIHKGHRLNMASVRVHVGRSRGNEPFELDRGSMQDDRMRPSAELGDPSTSVGPGQAGTTLINAGRLISCSFNEAGETSPTHSTYSCGTVTRGLSLSENRELRRRRSDMLMAGQSTDETPLFANFESLLTLPVYSDCLFGSKQHPLCGADDSSTRGSEVSSVPVISDVSISSTSVNYIQNLVDYIGRNENRSTLSHAYEAFGISFDEWCEISEELQQQLDPPISWTDGL